jgi:hypothetical protein
MLLLHTFINPLVDHETTIKTSGKVCIAVRIFLNDKSFFEECIELHLGSHNIVKRIRTAIGNSKKYSINSLSMLVHVYAKISSLHCYMHVCNQLIVFS